MKKLGFLVIAVTTIVWTEKTNPSFQNTIQFNNEQKADEYLYNIRASSNTVGWGEMGTGPAYVAPKAEKK